jgi:hypothetical protein
MVEFEWDAAKAAVNLKKHRVGFQEAATVLEDVLSTTFPDKAHSTDERRFVTIGASELGRLLVVAHTERNDTIRIISARRATRRSEHSMSKAKRRNNEDLLPEYDFASMRGGVRGKYVARLRKGSNLVLLEPEVAAAFPSPAAVNEALRGVLNTARAVRGKGGLPNSALQPTSRARRRAKRTRAVRATRG